MTGAVEVVSLVLAVFPLVISILENYEDGYRGLGDWVFFRREFAHLINGLNREQIIFRQHIERMLRSITESEFELKEMMDDLTSPGWESEELTAKLQHKLCGEGEYDNYIASIKGIHEYLVNMRRRVDRCGPPAHASNESAQKGLQLPKRFRKLQFAVQKNKWKDQVDSLGKQIDRVNKLFGEAQALSSGRQSKTATTVQIFSQTKSQALSLHKALSTGWKECNCQIPHTFKLMMSRRSNKTSTRGPDSHVLRISFPPVARSMAKDKALPDQNDTWCCFNTEMIDSNGGHRSSLSVPR
ncbi:hypothetical protein F4777DRAFT_222057 [Nemania sp. FL0916]|nr:hypothetical protein F4777DRAFT_222057 [Nemania sp. FL0916]